MASPPNGAPSAAASLRKLKRGEFLVEQGQRPKTPFVVASGCISVLQLKGGKTIELLRVHEGEILADEILHSPTQWGSAYAVALEETQVFELSPETIEQSVAKSPELAKLLLQGLAERVRATTSELKSIRIQREETACPGDYTARVFGILVHAARAVGKPVEGSATALRASWTEFQEFAVEILQEPASRIKEALRIVEKLGYVKIERGEKDQIQNLEFSDVGPIESFFEFFYSYHFKGGFAELLKTNEKAAQITREFLRISEPVAADRSGMVTLPFKPTIDALKAVFSGRFEADQLFALQHKGLGVKLRPTDDGGVLSFYREEFFKMLINWAFLSEIEAWNELGYVSTAPAKRFEPDAAAPASPKEGTTPSGSASQSSAPLSGAPAGALAANAAAEAARKPARKIAPPVNGARTFSKGDVLFEMGEPADRVFVLRSGLVSLVKPGATERDKAVEVAQASAPQMVGEEALMGAKVWELSAIAQNQTEVLEVSLARAQEMMQSFPGPMRLMMKGLIKKQEHTRSEVIDRKLGGQGEEACPRLQISKLFAVVYQAVKTTGKAASPKPGIPVAEAGGVPKVAVVWAAFRKYCHWGLMESPVRVEHLMRLLAHQGLAELEMVQSDTDPDGPEELGFVYFKDVEFLKTFYRFAHLDLEMTLPELIAKNVPSEDADTQRCVRLLQAIQEWNRKGSVPEPVKAENKAA